MQRLTTRHKVAEELDRFELRQGNASGGRAGPSVHVENLLSMAGSAAHQRRGQKPIWSCEALLISPPSRNSLRVSRVIPHPLQHKDCTLERWLEVQLANPQ